MYNIHMQTAHMSLFFFFFDYICCMQKFPDQGSKLCQSSNHSHSSNNTRSLTH